MPKSICKRGLSNGGCAGKFFQLPRVNLIESLSNLLHKLFIFLCYFLGDFKIGLRHRSGGKGAFFDTSLCEQHSERPRQSQIQENSNKLVHVCLKVASIIRIPLTGYLLDIKMSFLVYLKDKGDTEYLHCLQCRQK